MPLMHELALDLLAVPGVSPLNRARTEVSSQGQCVEREDLTTRDTLES